MATFSFSLLAFLSAQCVMYAFLDSYFGSSIIGDLFSSMSNVRCLGPTTNFSTFLLYSRSNPTDHDVLATGDKKKLEASNFDPDRPTKIIIHGFLDNLQLSDWMIKMKTELLMEGNYNVIIVDWSCGNGLPYNKAVENARKTGIEIADFMGFLQASVDANPLDFHLIGHSLGSQIAGVTGQRIGSLGRISALDPAGPKFYDAPLDKRLDPSDAKFVDVIHTDGGAGFFEGLGLHEQVGHVDFYPNGGRTQPGCHSSPFAVLQQEGLHRAARYLFTCDHYRSVRFYTATIRKGQCDFVGVTCPSWEAFSEGRCANCSESRCLRMGFHSVRNPTVHPEATAKEFYLRTSAQVPFCLYQYKVLLITDESNSSGIFSTKNGVMQLELGSRKGIYDHFKLNDGAEDPSHPGKSLVYLLTSAKPLEDVVSASLFWQQKQTTWTLESTQATPARPVKYRRLQVTLISMTDRDDQKLKAEFVLCPSAEKPISENQRLHLSARSC